ncbi:MAG: hypothetical protein ABW220_12010 [Burkholderiaceae bacterium]
MPVRRALLATVVALSLTGCVNLQPVSHYAGAAAEVAGSTDAARRWRDSEQHLIAHRLEGDVCPLGRPGRLPQERFNLAFDNIASIHQAMADYYNALATLAGDGVPRAAKTGAATLDAIEGAGITVTAQEKKAVTALYALINRALDGYRQRQVREMMVASHDDVASVLGLMRKLSEAYAEELRGERIQAVNFVRCEIGQGDLSDKYMARRELQRMRLHYDQELARLATYQSALDTLVLDHARIRDALALDGSAMTRALTALAKSARDLDRARTALEAL